MSGAGKPMFGEFVPYVPTPTCAVKRGPRSSVECELPPDHCDGAFDRHIGRSTTGRWFSWT